MKKNICLILPGKLPVPNVKGGAIETLLTLLIDQNEIDRQAHFIVVCAWTEGIEEVAKKYRNTEFHYFRIRNGVWKKSINLINYVISRVTGIVDFFTTPMHRDIEKIVANIDADYVVVEHGIYKHFRFLRKYFDRDRLFLHLHGTGPKLDKESSKTFGHVITVSNFLEDFYINRIIGKNIEFHVCLNGIDENAFIQRIDKKQRHEIRKEMNVEDDDLLVIYCGRLVQEKGVKELVRAIINTNNPKIKLMIVGSSNFANSKKTKYIKELETMIKDYKEKIKFTGYIPHCELYKYYQSADLQVIPSIGEEAAGLVAIEGQLSGLPLLVTNSGGLPEYIAIDQFKAVDKRNSLQSDWDSELLSKDITEYLKEIFIQLSSDQNNCITYNEKIHRFTGLEFYKRFINTVIYGE